MSETPPRRRFSLTPWILAARPKTLPASSAPVVVGCALAFVDRGFEPLPALLCLLFAVFAQIAANFVNDWADFRKGADSDGRLGPNRMVALGVLSPKSMLIGTFVALGIACAFGLGLIFFGGVKLILVGFVCALFVLLYSAGPFPLAYIGLGDAAVVAFFGLVAVGGTYYVQTGELTPAVLFAGLSLGFASDNILIANNYRDRDEDRKNRKFTTIALFGERFGRYYYLTSGLLTALFFALAWRSYLTPDNRIALVLPLIWAGLHFLTWRRLVRLRQGRALNEILERSAKNLLILALFYVCFALAVRYLN